MQSRWSALRVFQPEGQHKLDDDLQRVRHGVDCFWWRVELSRSLRVQSGCEKLDWLGTFQQWQPRICLHASWVVIFCLIHFTLLALRTVAETHTAVLVALIQLYLDWRLWLLLLQCLTNVLIYLPTYLLTYLPVVSIKSLTIPLETVTAGVVGNFTGQVSGDLSDA